jgi:hypothetical protein
MALDTVTVGSNQRAVTVLGDPTNASQMQSVLALADAKSLAGLFAAIAGSVPWLLNANNLYDQQRSAAGTTGIAAVSTESSKATYSVGVLAFTPVATPTDFWQIVGSATKTVRVLRIAISGIATAAISVDVQMFRRSAASTGGTPTPPTIASHDANDSSATAVVNTFAANPALGASAGVLRAQKLNLGATGAAGQIVWDFTTRNSKGLVLRGIAQQLSLNWNGAAVPAGTLLDIDVEFSEEAS